MSYPHICARAFGTPLLVHPTKGHAFIRGLGPRIVEGEVQVNIPSALSGDDGIDASTPRAAASLIGGELSTEVLDSGYGYALVDGVAIIPVAGVLVHRGAWIGKSSGVTSYEGLAAQIDAASRDDRVHGIALEIDCFGGEVSGCFDLADRIRKVGEIKPVRAFVADYAFSAAYALASACDRIVVSRTSGVGSIGVISMHVDYSGALEKDGIDVTIIHAGQHKADGNPYAALPDAIRTEWQGEMESLRQLFAQTVAAGRGERLDAAGALATEARCFTGHKAVREGLADDVSEPTAAFATFAASLDPDENSAAPAASPSATARKPGGRSMSRKSRRARGQMDDEDQMMEDEDEPEIEEDELDPDDDLDPEGDEGEDLPEDGAEEDEDKPAARRGDRASSERRRIAAILDCDEAQGQDALARHFAFSTDMSPRDAKAALAAASRSSGGKAKGGRLSERMQASGRSDLRPTGAAGGRPSSLADRMKAKHAK